MRLYMGWQDRFYQYEPELEYALDAAQNDDTAVALILGIIDVLVEIDADIICARKRLKALEVDGQKLPGPVETNMLKDQGKMYVGRMSAFIGVPIKQDVFRGVAQRRNISQDNFLKIW